MSKFIIQGGKKLSGTIAVSGNKNAVLPIMAATLLVSGDTTLTNVPRIRDVAVMSDILTDLGARVSGVGTNTLMINTDDVTKSAVNPELATRLRASVLLLGPMYARFGSVTLVHPGGDVIGKRSIDTHLRALEILGAQVRKERNSYRVTKKEDIDPHVSLFLDEPSVTATENVLMAVAYRAERIILENAALEPHIGDLVAFLQRAGMLIANTGGSTYEITGARTLSGGIHAVIPDYIEEGTFAALSAVTGSDITITNGSFADNKAMLHILSTMNCTVSVTKERAVISSSAVRAPEKRIQSGPHPNFPTDLMSPFIVLATQAQGQTLFHDPMYESRMFFVDKLIRMGAQITICDPHRVIVNGPTPLIGQYQTSPDIRAGIALVIAALIAEGESVIDHAEIIERGYENLVERLRAIGADITKVE